MTGPWHRHSCKLKCRWRGPPVTDWLGFEPETIDWHCGYLDWPGSRWCIRLPVRDKAERAYLRHMHHPDWPESCARIVIVSSPCVPYCTASRAINECKQPQSPPITPASSSSAQTRFHLARSGPRANQFKQHSSFRDVCWALMLLEADWRRSAQVGTN